MQDIYRLRKIVKMEEAARSMSSDGDQTNYEHSEGSPITEDEETSIKDSSEIGSTSEVDDDLDVLDEESDEYAHPGVLTCPPPGSANPHPYTAGAAAGMPPAISPVVPAASMEYTALSVVPATQETHYFAPPLPVPPPHDMPAGWYMPPPVVVNIPNPPYQMTLYPLYPVYFPSPTH